MTVFNFKRNILDIRDPLTRCVSRHFRKRYSFITISSKYDTNKKGKKKNRIRRIVTRTILHAARDRLARDRLTSVYTGINLITEQSRPLRPPSPWNSPRKRYFRMIQHTVPEWRATFDPCLPFCIAINLLTAASYVDERHSFSFFFSFPPLFSFLFSNVRANILE